MRLVFRDFPLGNHKRAQPAAEAAQCAHDQGKFWEFHDKTFTNTSKLSDEDLKQHARDLGLKIHCIESIDRRLLTPLYAGMKERGYKRVVAVLPDHLTPVERGDHVGQPVPVLIRDPDKPADGVTHYDEETVKEGALGALVGEDFVRTLLWRRVA